MRDKDIVFCSLCICYDNGCPFCKRCPCAQKMPAYRESWRQLMYRHTNLHSETCQVTIQSTSKTHLRGRGSFKERNKFALGNFRIFPYCSFHCTVGAITLWWALHRQASSWAQVHADFRGPWYRCMHPQVQARTHNEFTVAHRSQFVVP